MLMLSYAFPPVAASGTFRVARFAMYLPEFGWRPVVVTANHYVLDVIAGSVPKRYGPASGVVSAPLATSNVRTFGPVASDDAT